jgi:hypothetical protein
MLMEQTTRVVFLYEHPHLTLPSAMSLSLSVSPFFLLYLHPTISLSLEFALRFFFLQNQLLDWYRLDGMNYKKTCFIWQPTRFGFL